VSSIDLCAVTPTLCALLGIAAPGLAEGQPLAAVSAAAAERWGEERAERLLIFAPDALGRGLLREHASVLELPREYAPVEVELDSVLPTVTPVCFGTIFTGGRPEQHGIQKYERPRLACDSFFDALLRAGLSCALVVRDDCSMNDLYRGRAMDYFPQPSDSAVESQAIELIRAGRHQVVVAYQMDYDDRLHETEPRSPECLAAMRAHCGSFCALANTAKACWAGERWACSFIPDHGAHIDEASGKGTHGSNMPEDMELLHLWGLW
jgi:hypothetical protein